MSVAIDEHLNLPSGQEGAGNQTFGPGTMAKDGRRRFDRRPIELQGRIETEQGRPIICRLLDISHGGARIACHPMARVPTAFTLVIGQSGKVKRHCFVAWRDGFEIGVSFRSW
jgi:hypothetical protein